MPPKHSKPLNINTFGAWFIEQFGTDVDKSLYDQNLGIAILTVQEHPFFRDIESFLSTCSQDYQCQFNEPLLMGNTNLKLEKKSFDSLNSKLYRHNVVWNRSWPNQPQRSQWASPDTFYEVIDDLIRTRLVCRFLDGAPFLAQKLIDRGADIGVPVTHRPISKDDGYYAYHCYVKIPVEIRLQSGQPPVPQEMQIEVQLATQLQDALYNITHEYYRHKRDEVAEDDRHAWKWDISSNQFKAGYVGHTLHLLEATIVELRNSVYSAEDQIKDKTH